MHEPRLPRSRHVRTALGRAAAVTLALSAVAATGFWLGSADAHPQLEPSQQAQPTYNTLRVHGYPVVSNPNEPAHANRPATAGSDTATDLNTGQIPEDPPYTSLRGPFEPWSSMAPEMDFVTWNPAWISERLDDAGLRADWPGLVDVDEVSRAASIRAGGVDASEKVFLRHWYEPQHLDKDLNADGRLTDRDNNGVPDAPMSQIADTIDEWYPAIMTEFTYMLVDNDPLPQADPPAAGLHQSAPRPVCGGALGTQMVFPVGVAESETDPAGQLLGYGITSLDADFDGQIDMINVTDEASLPGMFGGLSIDFDGDGILDTFDTGGVPNSGDELVVLHTDPIAVEVGDKLQFLDHFILVTSVSDSGAVIEVWNNGDLRPRLMGRQSIGVGGALLAGDGGPVQPIAPGSGNLGSVPTGPWFAFLQNADATPGDQSAVLVIGRALGASHAAMESAPNTTNREPGGPYFLKRFYVDGHEYNVAAIGTCSATRFQYITLRAPVPKVPATIDQHSVRLQPYGIQDPLPLLPPFNYEHTVLEDVVAFEDFENVQVPPSAVPPFIERPRILYMGGPIGPVPPVLGSGDNLPYDGRDPADPVGPYNDTRASRWFYVDEARNPAMLGQLREKYGAENPLADPSAPSPQPAFFFNEQIWTLPWHFTEFVLPDLSDPAGVPQPFDADKYHVTSAFTAPTARWRRWAMPGTGLPAGIPPSPPPDLIVNNTPDGGFPVGAARRAAFWFDPDDPDAEPVKLWTGRGGVRLFGGQPERPDFPCDPDRPRLLSGAGDTRVNSDTAGVINSPVEIFPYTDPFAPFNPQHPHAPRADSLTANPAYMDHIRNFGEDLRALYDLLSNDEQNAREKVYTRTWYEPEYTSKIRFADECDLDIKFPAVVQEYTYAFMDTTDNPRAATTGNSRFGFPIGTRASELPLPEPGGTLPAGGEFGYGLTTFDANFDEYPDAVTVHTERTLAAYIDAQWQAHRPTIPGFPLPPLAGPMLDFDGDGILDTLNTDGIPLSGDELVVFAVESLTLDLDPLTPESPSAMVLDHLVTLEAVTPGQRGQFRFWFTGGNATDARPQIVNGVQNLEIGDAALVDRFQGSVITVGPGGMNTGPNGAWFMFLEAVAEDSDRVTITVGRALGATHSAIDDGNGMHDLVPGDPWYLKRFYVDGHEYNAVALFTQPGAPGADEGFAFITIRTPVPKGNVLNAQDSLFQQGYYIGDLPNELSVMPPFNVPHTIAVDIERLSDGEFSNTRTYADCLGDLAPAAALNPTVVAEEEEPRQGVELREIYDDGGIRYRWQTDQSLVIPNQYTELRMPRGQQYLFTSNWLSPVSRLAFYGCLRDAPPPFPPGIPGLTHEEIRRIALGWATNTETANIIPDITQLFPPQPFPPIVIPGVPPIFAPYFDARLAGSFARVKLFYDPADPNDVYFNRRTLGLPIPTPTATPTATVQIQPTSTTDPGGPTPTNTPGSGAPTPTTDPAAATPTSTTDPGGPTPTSTTDPGGPTPTNTPGTGAPTPTNTPGPGGTLAAPTLSCQRTDPFRIELTWTDNSVGETEFLIEVRVVGSGVGFAPVTIVSSATSAGTGTTYMYTSPLLAASTTYEWRVLARNPGTGATSPYSNTSACSTAPATMTACYKGKTYMQGRSNHAGTLIYVDGIPMARTDRSGHFKVCGLQPGVHTVATRSACYLDTMAENVYAGPSDTINLGFTALRGGDVNNDNLINIFDLVRVGADYRSIPPTDPEADCTNDSKVDLFDLVLVGSNYGVDGPIAWGYTMSATMAAAAPVDFTSLAAETHGDGAPVALEPHQQGDELSVDVTVRGVRELYGAELRLKYDPERLQVIDSAGRAGVQIEPGAVWSEGSLGQVAVNRVDTSAGDITFAATLLKPAEPLAGDHVLATVRFRLLSGDPEGAVLLSGVLLSDIKGLEIEAQWSGVDIVAHPAAPIYLPAVMNRATLE